jgi:Tfp pilus assembly protein PilO
MTMTRKWLLLTAVLIVAVFVASWFLLIAPKHDKVATLKAEALTQQSANDRLVQQLSELKAQSLDLPKQKAALAVFTKQVPNNPALPSMIRDLTAAAKKTGATIVTIAPQDPVALAVAAPVAPVAAPPATDSDASATGTDSAGTDTAPAPVVAAPPAPSLYQVPLKLKITGSYFELEQFINKLEGLRRSFLVSGFTLAANDSATAGASADAVGLDLDGRVFLAPTVAAAPAPTTPVASGNSSTTTQ